MHGEEAARVFEEIAQLMAFRGDNRFKIRAYETAARTLRALEEPLDAVLADGRVESLPGVGPAIARKIHDLIATGHVPLHDRLTAETPVGVLELLRVPGVGPKRARAAYETLGIDSLDALEAAARDGSLAAVPGFGARLAGTVLDSVGRVRTYRGRFLGVDGREVGALLVARLEASGSAEAVALAGDARRALETIDRVAVVAAAANPTSVVAAFCGLAPVVEVVAQAGDHAVVRLTGDLPAELRVTDRDGFPCALLAATGSEPHWRGLVARAAARGLALSSTGLRDGDGAPVRCRDETAVYAALGMVWVPPELREDRGEMEAACGGRLPALVEPTDVRGAVHCHTTWSDGRASIEEMARAAADRGYSYLAVCDHSRSLAFAGGLDVDDLVRQGDEIAAVNARGNGATVLAGIEVDVLRDGRLDLPDEALARLDCVVASVHSHLGLPSDEQTARVVRALAHPYVHILGHPSGRQLLRRPPCALDMDAVLDAAAEHRTAIEINGQPRRLDLDWRWHQAAVSRGVGFVVTSDAHGPDTLAYVDHAVAAARKGGLAAADVLNTRALDDFLAGLKG